MNTTDVLRNLVEARKRRCIRQIDVANAMGIGQPAVSELERGETSPKLETLQRYADAIDATIVVYITEGGVPGDDTD